MKTLRLVATIMALTAFPLQGQLELSAGMNLSDLAGSFSGSELNDLGNRAGMAFGLDLVLPMGGMGLNLGCESVRSPRARTAPLPHPGEQGARRRGSVCSRRTDDY